MAQFLTELAVKIRGPTDFKLPASTWYPDVTRSDFNSSIEKVETGRSWKFAGEPAQSKQLASDSVLKRIPPTQKIRVW